MTRDKHNFRDWTSRSFSLLLLLCCPTNRLVWTVPAPWFQMVFSTVLGGSTGEGGWYLEEAGELVLGRSAP